MPPHGVLTRAKENYSNASEGFLEYTKGEVTIFQVLKKEGDQLGKF